MTNSLRSPSTKFSFLMMAALAPTIAFGETLLKAESVPTTAVKDQGYVGFCWSYTVHGLMESEHLKRTGVKLDLSEEYVGFHHLYNQILENIPVLRRHAVSRSSKNPLTPFKRIALELLVAGFLHPSEGSSIDDMIRRVGQVGALPESVFSFKISTEADMVQDKLITFALEHLIYREDLDYFATAAGREDLYARVSEIFGARAPKPDDAFVFEGKTYTPRTFARDYLGFNSTAYRAFEVDETNHVEALRLTRKALEADIAVPIGYMTYEDTQTGMSTGRFDPAQCGGKCTSAEGGHAVLAVNATLIEGTGLPIDGLLIKNSWGSAQGLNSAAQLEGLDRGFNIITESYLRNAIADRKGWWVTLPSSISGPSTDKPRVFPVAKGSKTHTIRFSETLKRGPFALRPKDDAMMFIMSAMGRSISVSRKNGESWDPSVAAPVVERIDFNVKDGAGKKWATIVTLSVENTSREEMVQRFRDFERTKSAQ
jgi:hypothetical protein